MPRPTPPPHPAEAFVVEHYSRRVVPVTRRKYAAIWRRMERSEMEPRTWLRAQVDRLDGTQQRAVKTTIGVLRSAILYYLCWQHHLGTGAVLGPEEVMLLGKQLPTAAEGDRGEERTSLSPEHLDMYRDAVQKLPVYAQIKTVLLLLPHTGLRIFEACGLRAENVVRRGSEWKLNIVGKGNKPRVVPLNRHARELVEPYLSGKAGTDFLFDNPYYLSVPWSTRLDLSPAQVRAVVRDHLQPLEELADVVPHVLRHQFASDATKKKVDIFTLKKLLGHSSTATLERYTHPDEDMLRDAVNRLDE